MTYKENCGIMKERRQGLNALNAGATLANIHITTIHTAKKKFETYKESCEYCSYAFRGKIKKYYSGWIEGE